jgi:hypothetical protein
MLLIGSAALKWHHPDHRPPMDVDFIAWPYEVSSFFTINRDKILSSQTLHGGAKCVIYFTDVKVELEVAQLGSSNELLLQRGYQVNAFLYGMQVSVADVVTLLTIKKSHMTKPINWWKHITDYEILKCLAGKEIPESHKKIYDLRVLETDTRMPSTKPYLDISNDEFFKKSQETVGRVFNHDDLHRLTKFYAIPLFDHVKIDKNKASCSRGLFEALSHTDQIKCVQEEAFVIALERIIIPDLQAERTPEPLKAYKWAIERISTTLTSGWFREFSIENALEILNIEKLDYYDKFKAWWDNVSLRRVRDERR